MLSRGCSPSFSSYHSGTTEAQSAIAEYSHGRRSASEGGRGEEDERRLHASRPSARRVTALWATSKIHLYGDSAVQSSGATARQHLNIPSLWPLVLGTWASAIIVQ